jgi:hypothetical protein
VNAVVCAGAGFLLAVLWFDLMFDVQVRGHPGEVLPEPVLASITSYYGRVVTRGRPMNLLIAGTMLATIAAVVVEIARGDDPAWVAWVSLALVGAAVGLARVRTIPNAARLGMRADPPERQSALARAIHRDHVGCFIAILGVLVAQLAF